MSDFQVWGVAYDQTYTPASSGIPIDQLVKVYLLVTPHALLKFKVVQNKKGSMKTRVFTDIQPQGRMLDLGAVKRHDYFRSMTRREKVGSAQVTREPTQAEWGNLNEFLKGSGINVLINNDEKAQNALMTAMGHHGELMLPEIMEKARAETKVKREEALAIQAKEKLADEMWGIF